jgi:hypothetical protein
MVLLLVLKVTHEHLPGLVGAPWGIELEAENKSSDFSNLKFDLPLGPAVSLAKKGIRPSVPIPVFKEIEC